MTSQPPKFRKGRGALSNPEGRFETRRIEAVDDGWGWTPDPADLTETTSTFDLADELPPLPTTVLPEHAKSIITRNNSPDIPFEQSINPYRGCENGCVYCLSGDTQILMADGSAKCLVDVREGDEIFGTERGGWYRRYTKTKVLAHWKTRKEAYRITLADSTTLVASADHRFLTERGWKFVTGAEQGLNRRPHLTTGNKLMGFGITPAVGDAPNSSEYRAGYLCGVIRGDGHLGTYSYPPRTGRTTNTQHHFRLAMCDSQALDRTALYLAESGVKTRRFLFQPMRSNRKEMQAIRTHARESVATVRGLVEWPKGYAGEWARGFVAGIFDAEGSFSDGILRIANGDAGMIEATTLSLREFGFDTVTEEARNRPKPMFYVRVRGGLREHLRFFRTFNPCIDRKRSIQGQSVKSKAALDVVSIEKLEGKRELFDITTGTGDFIANGVVSHNCYARPMHAYVNLSPGLDFETKLFYKNNAAALLEKELSKPGYICTPINIGASTDPYQPIERKLKITRSLLEVMLKFKHPVTLITKGALVTRDVDILSALASQNLVKVFVSITSLDPALKRGLEPRAPSPAARLQAVRQLSQAGIPVGVMAAPMIPVVNDHELEAILEAAVAAGAQSAGYVLLRLPYEVKDLFREWLQEHLPLRADHVMSLINQMRGGRDNDPRYGTRMSGEGVFAQLIARRFKAACLRLGVNLRHQPALSTEHFCAPGAQISLF